MAARTPSAHRLALLALLAGACTCALASAHPTDAEPPARVAVTAGVRLPPGRAEEIERLVWAVADPASPSYGSHLSRSQARALRASASADLDAVSQWLAAAGCSGARPAETRDAVEADCPRRPDPATDPRAADLVDYVHVRSVARGGRAASDSSVDVGDNAHDLRSRRRRQLPPTANHGTPARQREFYALPSTVHARSGTKNAQMVWGCGTFGVNLTELQMYHERYCSTCAEPVVTFDTKNHGHEPGDNFDEGTLDTTYITAFGQGVPTVVSNTNTSMATEEGEGQGAATVFFMETLADRATVPLVLSLSLGSLSFGACDSLCSELARTTSHTYAECHDYIQRQRQVCLYASYREQERINTAFKLLGLRGTTVLGASGDGGPHWSFGPFSEADPIGSALTAIGCQRMSPLFPASSPYILAVGGISWAGDDPSKPVAWNHHEGSTGGGFSDEWAMPAFQQSAVDRYFKEVAGMPGVPPPSQFNRSNRAYPDVAAFMDGVPLCVDGHCSDSICGGTSASTPTVAGILSLVNEARLGKGLPPLGFVVPRLWAVAEQFPGEAFADVTAPANTSTGCFTYFPQAKGWDPQTGWGYPQWPGMVKHFASDDWIEN